MAFATPIVTYLWPDSDAVNGELRDLILAAEAKGPASQKNIVGGWGSEKDLLNWDSDAIRTLASRFQQMVDQLTRATSAVAREARLKYRTEAWANVLRHGNYHGVHTHPNFLWSGVYYVAGAGADADHPMSGQLELLDPRTGADAVSVGASIFQQRYKVDPKPGVMVWFPSWTKHLVHPYFGEGERISIAFNAVPIEVRVKGRPPA